ncbi:hypothetical protein BLNAU_21673 [Blattamonas nauphoetae]|uniref:Right handed beta helix domain-containing protein n=1 Tax=Blattamonas nauphoetae TaxID=2049346 RepID=A0ABQ9WV86_9EUKA|nr:hypothetical protein BLNAU_21673 [Blattamonas nauphoetae]
MIKLWVDHKVKFIILTWTCIITHTIHGTHVADLGEATSSHSRTTNLEESPLTIILQDPRYESKTVEISSKHITVNGNIPSRPTIFESQQVKGTLLQVTNSTASFSSLAFQPLTVRILTVINHSEYLVANSVISVIEDLSPIECSDSAVRVLNSEFDFSTSQNHSPSLSTTASTSSTVSFHSCSFSDDVVTAPGSFVSCSSVQTSETDRCRFSNISHCPSFCKPSLAPLVHTVSVLNTHFVDCENVLFGGVVRDTEDRTSLLAANTTFTRSRSTYTNITGKSFGPTTTTTAQVVSVDHRYEQCTFIQCVGVNVNGGGIRCESGASLAADNCTFVECKNTCEVLSGLSNGGGVFMDGSTDVAGVSITRSFFSKCEARYGEGLRFISRRHLVVQSCNISECQAVDHLQELAGHWGGGLALSWMPAASVLSNIHFADCKATYSGSCLDNNNAQGSITSSNLLFAHGEGMQALVICSSVAGDPDISFFSCLFISNVAHTTREGTVNGTTMNMALGNDIMFHHLPVWERVLKDKSSFVNCFSTSAFPRIALQLTHLIVDFSSFVDRNDTLLDIHLPTLGIAVSADAGSDADGCGSTDLNQKCRWASIGECPIPN